MVARRGVSKLRSWAQEHVVIADGPKAGKRWRPGNAAWGEVLDSMDDSGLEQVTIRGSVQSGKTASLLVAALGHSAAGRSVLFYEPDDKLRIAMSARVRAWARACRDPVVHEAWAKERPPHWRTYANGGRLEVLNAGARTAGLMRTAEIVILDELRAFPRDIILELVDRMAAYGGKGRLITASSADEEDICKTTTELQKSDARYWFVPCPACGQSAPVVWENVVLPKTASARPVYVFPCCRAEVGTMALKRAVGAGAWRGDPQGRHRRHARVSRRLLRLPLRDLGDHHASLGPGDLPPQADRLRGRATRLRARASREAVEGRACRRGDGKPHRDNVS